MSALRALAPAKLNLYLHITGKRDDGYHLLDSLVAFTQFGDELSAEPASSLSLKMVGEFACGLDASDNLVMQAATLLQATYGVQQGATLVLHKHIPVGAGLGGGSSDAAAALLLLNRLWGVGASLKALANLAAPLGADVPACLYRHPLHMAGIGHEITRMARAAVGGWLLLVNPRAHVATPKVYQQFASAPAYRPPLEPSQRVNFQAHHNDLQPAAMAVCPQIADVLEVLNAQADCKLARLCGSGATCFGWFESQQAAQQAASAIAVSHPNWWQCVTGFYDDSDAIAVAP